MATGKRYYWIKLKENFMTSDTVDYLMSQKDGANYVVLYQMLCIKTMNTNGVLASQLGEIIVPFEVEKMQRDCKYFSIDTIRIALDLYQNLGLVYRQTNGILQITNYNNMIGSNTDYAIQKQKQRIDEADKKVLSKYSMDKGVDNVHIDTRDKILDKEIENRDNTNNIVEQARPHIFKDVINYLNEKANTNYYSSSKATQAKITARINDGFTLENFETVIEKKVAEWKGTEFEKYLRPETLFGAKFEGYLNAKAVKAKVVERNYDED
jgi:uncharacterized phage protein (TIGR02220 family)